VTGRVGLSDAERAVVVAARRAILATISPEGPPRLVPICSVLIDGVIWTPIDEKPKATEEPLALARVRDIEREPRVTLLVDRWSEDWGELAWVRVDGHATVTDSDPAVVAALRAKYPQYVSHDLESRPMIRIRIERVTSWGI